MAKYIAIAAFILLLRALAMGQGETTSAIVGSVTDPTGAAISEARNMPASFPACRYTNIRPFPA
jgi:hypothetical protein